VIPYVHILRPPIRSQSAIYLGSVAAARSESASMMRSPHVNSFQIGIRLLALDFTLCHSDWQVEDKIVTQEIFGS
jgi:hypothetical protein